MKFTAAKTYEAWSLIARAQSPLVVVGRGVRIANAMEELSAFLKQAKLPVATTYLGKDCTCDSLGVIGIKGNKEANEKLFSSDVVLVLGASLPVAQIGYDPKKFFDRKVIIVNIETPNKLCKPTLFIQADVREFFYEFGQILRVPQFEP